MYYQAFCIPGAISGPLHKILEKEGEENFFREVSEYEIPFEDSDKIIFSDSSVELTIKGYRSYQKQDKNFYIFYKDDRIIIGNKTGAIFEYKKISK